MTKSSDGERDMSDYTTTQPIVDSCTFFPDKFWRYNDNETHSSAAETRSIQEPDLPEFGPNYRETVEKETKIFKEEARVLIERWIQECEEMSSFSDMISHPDYKTILAKGSKVIPVLFDELQHRPHYWFDALQILIKANHGLDVDPVNEEDRGNLCKMANAWLAWGKEHGYI